MTVVLSVALVVSGHLRHAPPGGGGAGHIAAWAAADLGPQDWFSIACNGTKWAAIQWEHV